MSLLYNSKTIKQSETVNSTNSSIILLYNIETTMLIKKIRETLSI